MLQMVHSAILSTIIKQPFVTKIFVCLFLSGHFKQVLLYVHLMKDRNIILFSPSAELL